MSTQQQSCLCPIPATASSLKPHQDRNRHEPYSSRKPKASGSHPQRPGRKAEFRHTTWSAPHAQPQNLGPKPNSQTCALYYQTQFRALKPKPENDVSKRNLLSPKPLKAAARHFEDRRAQNRQAFFGFVNLLSAHEHGVCCGSCAFY